MSVVYFLTSVIMFYINGLSKQFFTYVVGFPIIYFGEICLVNLIKKEVGIIWIWEKTYREWTAKFEGV